MKKIMMTLAAVCVAATMNAQTWAGGELGFTGKHINGAENSNTTFSIKPEIGYNLDDNLAVAVALGYTHTNPASGSNSNAFSINPYLRYTFVKAGNFSAFFDGGLDYTTTHTQGADKNSNSFGVSVVPGLAYAVSDKVTLVSHLGDGLYFKHYWYEGVSRSSSYGLNLFNAISFGAYYNF